MEALLRERRVEIEIAAVELMRDFDIKEFPISIFRIANALDITLIPYSSLTYEELKLAFAASDDAFHTRTHDFMDTRIVFDDTNRAHYLRSRFSSAHEIGHIVLEHREDTPNREREADYFSGYLLAPHPLVLMHGGSIGVAKLFGVSESCAAFACDQARARKVEGVPWLPHERWLIEHAIWKEGGLLACA